MSLVFISDSSASIVLVFREGVLNMVDNSLVVIYGLVCP